MTDVGPPGQDAPLLQFADYYGFDYFLLTGHDPYRIEGVTRDFAGKVMRIRVTECGRFGNIFQQLMHAAWLARQIGCQEIESFAFDAGPRTDRVEAGGLSFLFPRTPTLQPAPKAPTLVGHFFGSYAFESALRRLATESASELVHDIMRPVFNHIGDAPPRWGDRTLVVHFRAGDVFRDPDVSPWYVQPPAAFYTAAIAHARQTLDIEDVRLVFEDRANPAIALTESWLRQRGIPFASQSESLERDAICLATATHLVASVSTLVEAAAMLSRRLRTYIAFRQVEAHFTIHQRTAPLVAGVLRKSGVRLVVISDQVGGYTPVGAWRGAPGQIRLLTEYPETALSVADAGDAVDMPRAPELMWERLQSAETEAARLRGKRAGEDNRGHRRQDDPAAPRSGPPRRARPQLRQQADRRKTGLVAKEVLARWVDPDLSLDRAASGGQPRVTDAAIRHAQFRA